MNKRPTISADCFGDMFVYSVVTHNEYKYFTIFLKTKLGN